MAVVVAAGLSGRRAQAARNDSLILAAAKAVFVADPGAPIAAVAERAGVGISALYRRYRSKDELLQKLCADGLATFIAAAQTALADGADPWEAFAGFMTAVVAADTHALTVSLAGTFATTDELRRLAQHANELAAEVFARACGAMRPDADVNDIGLIFEQLTAVRGADDERTWQLRARYLAMFLDALRYRSPTPLPGPPPRPGEFAGRWVRRT